MSIDKDDFTPGSGSYKRHKLDISYKYKPHDVIDCVQAPKVSFDYEVIDSSLEEEVASPIHKNIYHTLSDSD